MSIKKHLHLNSEISVNFKKIREGYCLLHFQSLLLCFIHYTVCLFFSLLKMLGYEGAMKEKKQRTKYNKAQTKGILGREKDTIQ